MRAAITTLLALACLTFSACGSKPAATTTPQLDLDAKFRKLVEGGITLIGRSTNSRSDKIDSEERYIISSASKLEGDTWMLTAKIKYDGHEVPIPLPVHIRWAGDDTPVICVTNAGIPGIGSYTARVLLYGDQYAGTWSSSKGDYGGQLFGKIVRGVP